MLAPIQINWNKIFPSEWFFVVKVWHWDESPLIARQQTALPPPYPISHIHCDFFIFDTLQPDKSCQISAIIWAAACNKVCNMQHPNHSRTWCGFYFLHFPWDAAKGFYRAGLGKFGTLKMEKQSLKGKSLFIKRIEKIVIFWINITCITNFVIIINFLRYFLLQCIHINLNKKPCNRFVW